MSFPESPKPPLARTFLNAARAMNGASIFTFATVDVLLLVVLMFCIGWVFEHVSQKVIIDG